MDVEELLTYLQKHGKRLNQQILEGKYKPNPVRRVEVPKEEKGKFGATEIVNEQVIYKREKGTTYGEKFRGLCLGFIRLKCTILACRQFGYPNGKIFVSDTLRTIFFIKIVNFK